MNYWHQLMIHLLKVKQKGLSIIRINCKVVRKRTVFLNLPVSILRKQENAANSLLW